MTEEGCVYLSAGLFFSHTLLTHLASFYSLQSGLSYFFFFPLLYNKYMQHVFLFLAAAFGSRSSQLVELCSRFNGDVCDEQILEIYPQLENWKYLAPYLGLTQIDVEAIERMASSYKGLMRVVNCGYARYLH